jgi:hypothetical protein
MTTTRAPRSAITETITTEIMARIRAYSTRVCPFLQDKRSPLDERIDSRAVFNNKNWERITLKNYRKEIATTTKEIANEEIGRISVSARDMRGWNFSYL